MKKNNIVLIGFMGSGKTSVAGVLAKISGYKVFETDTLIEQQFQTTISDIFQKKGEAFFRQEETKVLEGLKDKENTIISTGGGIITNPRNIDLLKNLGRVFFLEADKKTILKRVGREKHRPLLENIDKEAQIFNLLEKRMPFYLQCADYVIKTDNKNINIIAKEIANTLSIFGKHNKFKK